MLINYWDCEFSDYYKMWDDEDDVSIYRCTHPNGTVCNLNNKFSGDKDNCKLIDEPEVEQMKCDGQISLKRLSAFVAIVDKASAIMQSELKATRVKTSGLLSVESIAKEIRHEHI